MSSIVSIFQDSSFIIALYGINYGLSVTVHSSCPVQFVCIFIVKLVVVTAVLYGGLLELVLSSNDTFGGLANGV